MRLNERWDIVRRYSKLPKREYGVVKDMLMIIAYEGYKMGGGKKEIEIDGTNDVILAYYNFCEEIRVIISSTDRIMGIIDNKNNSELSRLLKEYIKDVYTSNEAVIIPTKIRDASLELKFIYGNNEESLMMISSEHSIKEVMIYALNKYIGYIGNKLSISETIVEYAYNEIENIIKEW